MVRNHSYADHRWSVSSHRCSSWKKSIVQLIVYTVYMIKHAIGLVLHCIGIGLWFLLLSWLLLWACIFLVPVVPLAFILGYLTSAHIRTQKWDAFISFFGWEYFCMNYVRFSVHGDTDGQKHSCVIRPTHPLYGRFIHMVTLPSRRHCSGA